MSPSEFTKKVTKRIGGKKFILDLSKYEFESITVSILYDSDVDLNLPRSELVKQCEHIRDVHKENITKMIHEYIDGKHIEIENELKYVEPRLINEIKEKINKLEIENNFSQKINTGNILESFKNKYKKILGIVKETIETDKLKSIVSEYFSENEYLETFPVARQMKRKFIFHFGPTNSGKTYASLKKLKDAETGYYLAPLRLLAHEIYEELNDDGYPTDLVTGEEHIFTENSKYRSSTIEMASFTKPVDVAIIDEIQMIADPYRGWAWTQAVVGVPAETIILAGSADAIPNVKHLVQDILGEELELVGFERKNQLIVEDLPTTTCEPGDAVIVFSRKRIFEIKEQLKNQCSIIYGSLGPEVRKSEAKKFKDGENGIVVSTDAIGMGLNLPIRRVIFADIEKFNGTEFEIADSALIKQIAGRAGRYGKFENGLVSATSFEALEIIRKAMDVKKDTRPLRKFQISPNLQAIKLISDHTGSSDIIKVLNQFSAVIANDKNFVMMNIENMRDISRYVYDKLPLDIKFIYSCVPINTKLVNDLTQLFAWSKKHHNETPIMASDISFSETVVYDESMQLRSLEDKVKLYTVYLWLSQRYPDIYVDSVAVKVKVDQLNSKIMQILGESQSSKKNKKLRIK